MMEQLINGYLEAYFGTKEYELIEYFTDGHIITISIVEDDVEISLSVDMWTVLAYVHTKLNSISISTLN